MTARISLTTPAPPRPPMALPGISTSMSMTVAPPDFRDEELLADVIAGLIGDARHAAIGNASPIPAMAALLAQARGKGRPYVSLLGSRRHNFFTDGGRELFDCAGQGRIDVFFLSGGQIDGHGNINLVSIGDQHHPKVRFPGSFGSGYLYYVVPKVILFRWITRRAAWCDEVDFISAPGTSAAQRLSSGGTDRAGHQPLPVLVRSRAERIPARKRASRPYGRGGGRAIPASNSRFRITCPTTPAPSAETLRLIREVVAPQLAETYPQVRRRACLASNRDRQADVAAQTSRSILSACGARSWRRPPSAARPRAALHGSR